jgi:membrane-associated HD superfamily phosphohydrolase
MKSLAYSAVFFLIMNVLVAVIMAVSGFDFTFPNPDIPDVHGYYIWYGVFEFIVVLGTLVFAEHIWNKND